MQYSYDDIQMIVADLTAYRKSALTVRIDLGERLLHWNDSIHWNNNFVRSLSSDWIRRIRTELPNTHLLCWVEKPTAEEIRPSVGYSAPCDAIWQVSLIMNDGREIKLGGICDYPDQWSNFRTLVEGVARLPFRIRS